MVLLGSKMTRKEALRFKKQFNQLTDQIQRELNSSLKTRKESKSFWESNRAIDQAQKKRLKILVDVFYRTIDEALKK